MRKNAIKLLLLAMAIISGTISYAQFSRLQADAIVLNAIIGAGNSELNCDVLI